MSRSYQKTILVDLTAAEEEILAGFHRNTRRNIRQAGKKGFELEPIVTAEYAERLGVLLAESMARTGAVHSPENWEARIGLASSNPGLYRVVGQFVGAGREATDLVAYACGRFNGDHVEYSVGASTRIPGSRVPLNYALIWDLIRWAKRSGASWLDLGGVTEGRLHSSDPVGGISDFKRFFNPEVTTVGEEWILLPSPLRARLANGVSRFRKLF